MSINVVNKNQQRPSRRFFTGENMQRNITIRHEVISISQWANIPDNPRQRDTQRHAVKSSKHHLAKPSLTHLEVSAAELPDGAMIKLDGHTRSYLWSSGKLESLSGFLNITIYPVATIEEAKNLYLQFDNQKAAESSSDRGYGALRENGINAKTPFIYEGKIRTSLEMAEWARTKTKKAIELGAAVGEWKEEIQIIDELHICRQKMNSWILAAALITTRKRGDSAINFWSKYARDEGIKSTKGRDGVEMLNQYVINARKNREVGSTWASTHTPKAVAACEGFIAGYWFSHLRSKDLLNYLK